MAHGPDGMPLHAEPPQHANPFATHSERQPLLPKNLNGDVHLKGPPPDIHLSDSSDAFGAAPQLGAGAANKKDKLLFAKSKNYADRLHLHLQNVVIMVLLPWGSFLVVCCTVAFASPGSLWQIFGYVSALALASFGFLLMNVYLAMAKEKKQPIYLYLGGVVIVAVILGLLVGRHVFAQDMSEYWLKGRRPTYGNVSPTAAAAAFPDAGTIHFTVDSRIDLRRVMGFRPQGDPSTYCVAPILEEGQLEQVSFWAVGKDCCGASWDFRCDSARDPQARSGAVVSGSGPEAATERNRHFFEAAKQAAERYHLFTPPEPVLVRWMRDPDVASTEMMAEALQVVGVMGMLLLLLFVFLAGFMHFTWASKPRNL
jgi:hypothetical protein